LNNFLKFLVIAALLTACETNSYDDGSEAPAGRGHTHLWGAALVITEPPTCARAGHGIRVCAIDQTHTEPVDIDPLGHIVANWTPYRTATATRDGEDTGYCNREGCDNKDVLQFNGEYATGTPGLAFELINGDTEYRVRKGSVTSGQVYIPAMHRADADSPYLHVTEIGAAGDVYPIGAFYNTNITSVRIPEGVRYIGHHAFMNCHSLTNVTIPASLTSVGSSVFAVCDALSAVTFATGCQLKTFGPYMFSGCTSLTGITIPASITEIGRDAFNGCDQLRTVIFAADNRLEKIVNAAFMRCTSLTRITIPASVTEIGFEAFHRSGLTTVTFEEGSRLEIIGDYAFEQSKITAITIPASVTEIAGSAFSSCTSLRSVIFEEGTKLKSMGSFAYSKITSITIPAGVTNSLYGAFDGCASLANINVEANNPSYTGRRGILYNKDKTILIAWPTASGDITIPAGVTSIGNHAFEDCWTLTGVTIPEGVMSIGGGAFLGCYYITDITIPASVTSIGQFEFASWQPWQTIYVKGHASEEEADAAWGTNWRYHSQEFGDNSGATIKYWNGTSYE